MCIFVGDGIYILFVGGIIKMIIDKTIFWSEEDLNIIKEKGKELSIDEIINLLSVKRTPKAIKHKLSKFGIYKKQKVIKNYDNIKYINDNGIIYKLCKQCERYLPSNEDYFPADYNIREGIRNVCRECKGEEFKINSNVEFWTDNEIKLLINNYSTYSNPELIMLFLNNRTISSLEHKSKELNLSKDKQTINRLNKNNGILTSIRKLLNEDWQGQDNPQYNSQRFGELNPNYKGGISALYQELRRNLKQWKIDSVKNNNYVSFLTGNRFDDIHHLYSFDNIVKDTLNETGLPIYEDISFYSDEEIKQLVDKCIEIHYRHPLGICLEEKYHMKFHEDFGYGNNTPEQFNTFLDNYYNGKYKNLEKVG